MRYIITGATGFIGQKLISKLLLENNEVIAIVRPGSVKNKILPKNPNLTLKACDLSSLDCLNLPESDVFIHLGWKGITGSDRQNSDLQRNNLLDSTFALKLAQKCHCKTFFFAGSQAEYGDIREMNYEKQKETNELNPTTKYGYYKNLFGYYLLKEKQDMKAYHGRIFSVYGPNDQPNSLIETMIKTKIEGKKMLLGPCEHDWNFTYIDDISNMILGLIKSGAPSGIYNLASKDTRPLKEFVNSALENIPSLYPGTCIINGREGGASDIPLRPDTSKLREYVEVFDTPFEEGILQTINYDLKRKKVK